jgi:hypothetical protein
MPLTNPSYQCTPTVDNVADIKRSISSLARQDNGGLVLPPDIFTNVYRKLIIGLAAEHLLPLLTRIELRARKLSVLGVAFASLPHNSQSSK